MDVEPLTVLLVVTFLVKSGVCYGTRFLRICNTFSPVVPSLAKYSMK